MDAYEFVKYVRSRALAEIICDALEMDHSNPERDAGLLIRVCWERLVANVGDNAAEMVREQLVFPDEEMAELMEAVS